jgi:hypothetical protein
VSAARRGAAPALVNGGFEGATRLVCDEFASDGDVKSSRTDLLRGGVA